MPTQQLDIQVADAEDVAVLSVAGAVDASTIESLRRAVEPLCKQEKPRIILDCSNLSYVNSMGFALLFSWHQLCQKNQGKFVLCGLRDKIFNVIRLLGMADHLSISPSQDEAKTLVSR